MVSARDVTLKATTTAGGGRGEACRLVLGLLHFSGVQTSCWSEILLTSSSPSSKGTFQKRFSGFCPLRGGWGYPPFPLRVFGQDDFPLRGGGGYPPIPLRKIPLKTCFLGQKALFFAFFHAFLALFGPLYGLFDPF